jgi:tetratricopeptide (TPR) repeat protein
VVGLIVLGAAALGAGQLVDRFQSSAVTSDIRFRVWRDSLKVLAAHPWGIGRGAFDRVFPIYRTVKAPFALRFAFVENEPLQLLIDCGWALFAALAAAFGLVAWVILRQGRRDKIEAALVAGLFAVLVHNLVDFGLETPGVLLPFTGILATVLGRIPAGEQRARAWPRWLAVGAAGTGCLVGILAIASPTYDDFDALLKKAHTRNDQQALLQRARRSHPLDYFYALAQAELEPLRGMPGRPSPRFHALNQALELCPSCEAVHLTVARNLWSLGMRPQALLEWRSAVELQPALFNRVLGDVFALGAKPAELASIATSDPVRMIDVAGLLAATGRLEAANTVLDQAAAVGAPKELVLLTRARVELQGHQVAAAGSALAALRAAGFYSPQVATVEAQVALDGGAPGGADEALKILDLATARYPANVELEKMRLDLVVAHQKWSATARALAGYKQALYARDGSATEAHLAAARIDTQLSHYGDALGEYRIALADQPTNVALWMELGHTAESAGRPSTARDAYSEADRLSPKNPEITAALRRLDETTEVPLRRRLFGQEGSTP